MVKYFAVAMCLKGFSSCSLARRIYRGLGNRIGGRKRTNGGMPAYYPDRIKRILRLNREHNIVRDGDRILELGTGWLHWEAISLRLFFDIKAVLFDVWDNRQLGGLKNYLRQLSPLLENGFGLDKGEIERAQGVIRAILAVSSFEELYHLLGFEYVVESSGSLARFQDGSFRLVVSGGVLEHVSREALPKLIKETNRVLREDGWAVHSIDTSDHLSHYDASVNKKRYLSYSENFWNLICANEVQYINRMQRGEWLDLFEKEGFVTVEEETREVDIRNIKVAPRYARMAAKDLACTVLRLALKKPPATGSERPISAGG